jgi:hypothetical protein
MLNLPTQVVRSTDHRNKWKFSWILQPSIEDAQSAGRAWIAVQGSQQKRIRIRVTNLGLDAQAIFCLTKTHMRGAWRTMHSSLEFGGADGSVQQQANSGGFHQSRTRANKQAIHLMHALMRSLPKPRLSQVNCNQVMSPQRPGPCDISRRLHEI